MVATAYLFESFRLSSHAATTTAEPMGDGDLVRRARDGDRRAEEALYRNHVRYVHGLLLRLLGNHADAEDALQETFVIALDQLGQLREPDAFRGWLAQIAVSRARRRFRNQKLLRMLRLDSRPDDATLAQVAGPSASPAVRAELATLRQVLERLPADQRIAWSLRHVEGESLEEVAAHCDCSLATAKRRIAAADLCVVAELGEREVAS